MTRPGGQPADRPDRNRLQAVYESLRSDYESALAALCRELRTLLESRGYTPTIKFRVKRFESYSEKLSRAGRGKGVKGKDAITDLLGIRVVTPFLEDVEEIERLIGGHFAVVETERKAEEHSFREFGYDSVHLSVRLSPAQLRSILPGTRRVCEIQLRTILQDAWAEVEHELIYKSDIDLPNRAIRRKLASLNATLALSDLIFQELRDYQKQIRHRARQRRAGLTVHAAPVEEIVISHPTGEPEERQPPFEPVPLLALTSSLEKTMMAALEAHSMNDLATAIELYGKLLGMKLDRPVRSLVYNHRGMAHFVLGEYRQALHDFTRAITYNPGSSRNFGNRGLCRRVLGDLPRSLADYDRALQLSPHHPENLYGRAQARFEARQFRPALGDCERLLGLDREHAGAAELARRIRREML